MIFIFISIVLTSVIFFVYGLSLPNRGVIDLSFEGNMSCYFSEEGVGCSDWFHSLTVIYTIKRLNHHFYYANSKNYIPTLLVKLFNFFWCSPLHYKKNTKLHINKNKQKTAWKTQKVERVMMLMNVMTSQNRTAEN